MKLISTRRTKVTALDGSCRFVIPAQTVVEATSMLSRSVTLVDVKNPQTGELVDVSAIRPAFVIYERGATE